MNEYKKILTDTDTLQAHLDNFLINSWSYSKVSAFARNEKAFEMSYIYGIRNKRGVSTIAGEAYHAALDYYFAQKKEGKQLSIVEIEMCAFQYMETVPANVWKLGKTTPTVESAVIECLKVIGKLLRNFYAERGLYDDEIVEVISVEMYCDEWLTVNGVDIPLPCYMRIDLAARLRSGKVAIIDHKSKSSYTPEDEAAMTIGKQAITYVLGFEEKTGIQVDEVWFVENKTSENRDKSPQLQVIKVEMNENNRRLYEALLYEPLKRMLKAVQDPDYDYLINDSDKFVDMAEVYDFWARTLICEVEDFNVEESKKHLVAKRLRKIRDASTAAISPAIIKKFKENASKFIQYDLSNSNMTPQEKIEHVLRTFSINAQVAHFVEGYSSNTFLLEVSAGVQISSINRLRLDIAAALNVPTVRFSNNLVMYNGRSYFSLEHTKKRDRDLIFNSDDLYNNKIPLGRDNYGNLIVWDMDNQSTPHMLVCGATGSGKSVFIRSIMEYAKQAGINRMIILDPKYEFLKYAGGNLIVVNEPIAIEKAMEDAVKYMNELVRSGEKQRVLIVFDEFADALANARKGSELKRYKFVQTGIYANGQPKMKREQCGEDLSLEENLRLLLQKGRSCGIRIIAATQRASTKVITGDAKVNFPVQVCFRVPKETDSRVVIDEPGGESLAGSGDGLIKSPEYNDTVRFQAYYKPE